ncbi:MAG: hypothetical protein JXR76_23235 [Deltaproteobacteria bacterium]|nr:hypothetical protein [Deltaproteobacteria bacterium]
MTFQHPFISLYLLPVAVFIALPCQSNPAHHDAALVSTVLSQSSITAADDLPANGLAATASGDSAFRSLPRVMLLVFEQSSEDVLRIVENLQMRMFDVNVKFGVRWIKPPTVDFEFQLKTARRMLEDENIQLVFFWRALERDILYYQMPEDARPSERNIDDVGEESRPEAISIVIQTAVETLLDSGKLSAPGASSPARRPAVQTAPAKSLATALPEISEKSPNAPIRSRRYPHIYIQMGYEPNWVNSKPVVLHGGALRLGYQPVKTFRGFLGIGVTDYLVSSESGFSMKQLRIPIEIGLVGIVRRADLAVGFGGSFLLVPVQNSPSTGVDDTELKKPYWSQGVMLKTFIEFQYHISRYFELYADIHLLTNLNMVTYEVTNGPILFDEYHRFWPGMQVGIAFFLF